VTDETVQELSTQLSETELQAVYHSVNDAIFVHDAAGEIIDVNRAAVEMYGYSRSELRDTNPGAVSSGEPPYTEETARERVRRAADGETQTFEWQGRDSDGTVFWEEVSLSRAVVDGETRVLAIVRDIDDRKRAKHRFQTLIDNLPGIVYRCRNEPDWPMLFVGGQCEELTGYSAAAIESGEVSWGDDIIHPEDADPLEQQVGSALDAEEPFECTYRIQTKDGEERWVWERGREIDLAREDGMILEGFITDITDRKQYEQRLETQRDNLEVLNKVVRHDIRNKLQLVRIYADMLAAETSGEHADTVESVLEAAHNAVDITTTARDVTEVMLQSDADCHPVRLRPVLENEIDAIRSNYEHALVRVHGSIPEVDVIADDMLESVFRNLLTNAIQHNDKDLPEVTVSVTVDDGAALIRIADNGPGVPDERKDDIFEQGSMDLDSEGTGLGLYLVDTLLDRYGGDIRVEDNDPEGAVFVVELAVAAESKTGTF
jgi:PAS domain S-box-containing protein